MYTTHTKDAAAIPTTLADRNSAAAHLPSAAPLCRAERDGVEVDLLALDVGNLVAQLRHSNIHDQFREFMSCSCSRHAS